jgi:hypothetical protein
MYRKKSKINVGFNDILFKLLEQNWKKNIGRSLSNLFLNVKFDVGASHVTTFISDNFTL